MKTWINPNLEELGVSATAYSVSGGTVVDGSYTSDDGQYEIPTYQPSGVEVPR